jgi:hypothetical protein
LTHDAPPPQTLPQVPQLAPSFFKSTQEPFGHLVGVALMQLVLHVPMLQLQAVAPAGTGIESQLLPQAPQCAMSVLRLTHCPLHGLSPAGHPQTPPEHCWPPVHAVAHESQCIGSVWKFAHALLQLVSMGPESVVHVCTQAPLKQLGVVAEQLFPQVPQFSGSVFVLVQTPLQAVRGEQLMPSNETTTSASRASVLASGAASVLTPSGASVPTSRSTVTSSPPSPVPIWPSGEPASPDGLSGTVTSSIPPASTTSSAGSVRPQPSAIAASTPVAKNTYRTKRRPKRFMATSPTRVS